METGQIKPRIRPQKRRNIHSGISVDQAVGSDAHIRAELGVKDARVDGGLPFGRIGRKGLIDVISAAGADVRAWRVGRAAIAADARVLIPAGDRRRPLAGGAVVVRVYTAAVSLVAGAVMRRPAERAHHHVVFRAKCLPADRADGICIIRHTRYRPFLRPQLAWKVLHRKKQQEVL